MRRLAAYEGARGVRRSSVRRARSGPVEVSQPRRSFTAEVEHLAEVGCTTKEIGAMLNVSEQFLRTRFERQLRQGGGRFRGRLRELLLESAKSGQVPAQVLLSRLHLREAEEEGTAEMAEPERPLSDMTTSEMLEAYMKMRCGEGKKEGRRTNAE